MKKVQTTSKAAKKGSPISVVNAYNNRNADLDEWRNNNKKEGFVCINVNGLVEPNDTVIKELKKLDEKANPSDKETKRMKKARKPIFRFISSKDGKAKGGGFFLYSGYRDGIPLYFRAKSLIPNSSVQNFSIQWCNVLELWIKWLDTESEQNSIIANSGNTRLVISYTR